MIALELIGSLIQALPCKAGVHRWSVLDPRCYGEAIGCLECGAVRVAAEDPKPALPVTRARTAERAA